MIYPVSAAQSSGASQGFVPFRLGDHWLGIPVLRVQEVLSPQAVFPVPLAPTGVAGFLNLRGQVVTVLDLRCRFGMLPIEDASAQMHVVLRERDESFSLLVDEVGDVVDTRAQDVEPVPSTLDRRWRSCCQGVVRLPDRLLIVVGADELLSIGVQAAAA